MLPSSKLCTVRLNGDLMQLRWFLSIGLLLSLSLALCPAQAGAELAIRVGLTRSFRGTRQITATASSRYSILKTGSSQKLATFEAGTPATIQLDGSQLSISTASGTPIPAGTSVTIVPGDPASTIDIEPPGLPNKRYRGKIEISVQPTGMLVINVLDIEDYLPGVLVGEMPSSFPEEALKSQAVAARCYTLCARNKHATAGFNLCDGSHCQVYDGCLRETPKLVSAVSATKGQILNYKGKIASIMYHGDSGGVTQSYSDAYPSGSYPYLCSVTEPAGVPYSTWEKSYKPADLAAKLVAFGIKDAEGLQSIAVTKTAASGRVLELTIKGGKAPVVMSASRLRTTLGASTIKSTLFTIATDADGTITFKGRGHGHGVGMSQVGAKALAMAPFNYTYEQILKHYFPGTTLCAAADLIEPPKPNAARARSAPSTPAAQAAAPAFTQLGVRLQEPRLRQ